MEHIPKENQQETKKTQALETESNALSITEVVGLRNKNGSSSSGAVGGNGGADNLSFNAENLNPYNGVKASNAYSGAQLSSRYAQLLTEESVEGDPPTSKSILGYESAGTKNSVTALLEELNVDKVGQSKADQIADDGKESEEEVQTEAEAGIRTTNPDAGAEDGTEDVPGDETTHVVQDANVGDETPGPFRAEVKIDEELNEQQKIQCHWVEALEAHRQALSSPKQCSEAELAQWTRKQIRYGWSPGDEAKDPFQLEFTWVREKDPWNKEADILLITAWSGPDVDRWVNDTEYKGYYFRVSPLSGKRRGVIQMEGSRSQYNRQHAPYSIELINELVSLGGHPELAQAAIDSCDTGSDAFATLVENTQRCLIGDDAASGWYDQQTKTAVAQHLAYTRKKEGLEASIVSKDRPEIIAMKLYFVSGDLDLYQAAIRAFETDAQLPKVEFKESREFKALVASAQKVLFYNEESFGSGRVNGQWNLATMQGVDQWDVEFAGDEPAMDSARISRLTWYEYIRTYDSMTGLKARFKVAQNRDWYNYKFKGVQDYHSVGVQHTLYGQIKQKEWKAIGGRLDHLITVGKSMGYFGYSKGAQNTNENLVAFGSGRTDATSHKISDFPIFNPFDERKILGQLDATQVAMPFGGTFGFSPAAHKNASAANADYYGSNGASLVDELNKSEMSLHHLRHDMSNQPALRNDSNFKSWSSVYVRYEELRMVFNLSGMTLLDNTQPVALENPYEMPTDAFSNYPNQAPQYVLNDTTWKIEAFNTFLKDMKGWFALNTHLLKDPDYAPIYQLVEDTYKYLKSWAGHRYIKSLNNLSATGGRFTLSDCIMMATALNDNNLFHKAAPGGQSSARNFFNGTQALGSLGRMYNRFGEGKKIPAKWIPEGTSRSAFRNDHSGTGMTFEEGELTMMDTGIPLNIYWKKDGLLASAIVDINGSLQEVSVSTYGHTSDDSIIDALMNKIESEEKIPPGMLSYLKPNGRTETIALIDHMTIWEVVGNVLMAIAIALMVAAIPFTGGTSASAIPGLLALGSIVASIGSEIFFTIGRIEDGTLTGGQLALSGLNILASLLPGGRLVGGLAKMKKGLPVKYEWLIGRQFAVTSYALGATAAIVNGYVLTDHMLAAMEQLEGMPDSKEKKQALQRLLFLGLLYGGLTFISLKADVGGLKNAKRDFSIQNEFGLDANHLKNAKKLDSDFEGSPTLRGVGADGKVSINQVQSAAKQQVHVPPNSKVTAQVGASPTHGAPITAKTRAEASGGTGAKGAGEYTVNGKTYSKDDFVEMMHSRKFDDAEVHVNNPTKEAQDALNFRNQRNKAKATTKVPKAKKVNPDEVFDPVKLERIITSLESQGVHVWRGDDADKFLRNVLKAEAAYIPTVAGKPGMLILPKNASRVQVIEELTHLGQHRKTGFKALSEEDVIHLELDANRKLLLLGDKRNWNEAELANIRNAIKSWEDDLARLQNKSTGVMQPRGVDTEIVAFNHKGESGKKYKPVAKLKKGYKGEDVGEVPGFNTKYLSATERAKYEVFIGKDGKFYDVNGKLIHTSGSEYGYAIFVLGLDGKIYLGYHKFHKFHHSSFLAGADVAGAGEMIIVNGVLMNLSRQSGHYGPSAAGTRNVMSELNVRGANISEVVISKFN
jgi:hypothetical protein